MEGTPLMYPWIRSTQPRSGADRAACRQTKTDVGNALSARVRTRNVRLLRPKKGSRFIRQMGQLFRKKMLSFPPNRKSGS